MKQYIYDKVINIMENKIPQLKINAITEKSLLKEDIGINSILFYDLLIDLENEFHIRFLDVSINSSKYRSIGTLCDTIESFVEERSDEN